MWVVLFQIAVLVAISYGAAALSRKDDQQKLEPSDQIDVPTAVEGRPVGVLFGTKKIKGPNVVWYGDVSTTAIVR